jgi:hypothetical protein
VKRKAGTTYETLKRKPLAENGETYTTQQDTTITEAMDTIHTTLPDVNTGVKKIKCDHGYSTKHTEKHTTPDTCTCTTNPCHFCQISFHDLLLENEQLKCYIKKMEEEAIKKDQELLKRSYKVEHIKHSDSLVLMHTGVASYNRFQWIYKQVEPKVNRMQYYKGSQSDTIKSYQIHNKQKPGPKRLLTHENELLLTLMKLRLNLSEVFLAHLFGASISLVSQVLSTWLPLLAHELKPLIHWPAQEQL